MIRPSERDTALRHVNVVRGWLDEVYRARDARLGRDVAIKVLPAEVAQDPERRARFEREGRAVSS